MCIRCTRVRVSSYDVYYFSQFLVSSAPRTVLHVGHARGGVCGGSPAAQIDRNKIVATLVRTLSLAASYPSDRRPRPDV